MTIWNTLTTEGMLRSIAQSAFQFDDAGVIDMLERGVPYRTAMMYVERFYENSKDAAEFIRHMGVCSNCSRDPASVWKTKPLCTNCYMKIELYDKIEYAPVSSPPPLKPENDK